MNPFAASPRQIAALVAGYPLAWVVSAGGPHGFAATPLPLLAELDADGAVMALFGHFALANPQVALLQRQPAAMILFQGPQAYVAPGLVENPTWAPTWNYAVARFAVTVRFVPDETDAAIERLAAFLERANPQPWTPAQMGPRRAQLARHIIAFRAQVTTTDARFKLGQDENRDTLAQIIGGLSGTDLADWMRNANPSACPADAV